jgi:hypothetical protein
VDLGSGRAAPVISEVSESAARQEWLVGPEWWRLAQQHSSVSLFIFFFSFSSLLSFQIYVSKLNSYL